jgi:hypothetical protein
VSFTYPRTLKLGCRLAPPGSQNPSRKIYKWDIPAWGAVNYLGEKAAKWEYKTDPASRKNCNVAVLQHRHTLLHPTDKSTVRCNLEEILKPRTSPRGERLSFATRRPARYRFIGIIARKASSPAAVMQ